MVMRTVNGPVTARMALASVFHEVVAGGVWLNDEKCS